MNKNKFIINYLEILYSRVYNIQDTLLYHNDIINLEKDLIRERLLINKEINIGINILKNDLIKDENIDIKNYINNNSLIIKKYTSSSLIEDFIKKNNSYNDFKGKTIV